MRVATWKNASVCWQRRCKLGLTKPALSTLICAVIFLVHTTSCTKLRRPKRWLKSRSPSVILSLTKETLDRINSDSNLGLVYLSEGQYRQALGKFQACAQIRNRLYKEKVTDVDYVAASNLHIGMAYTLMLEFDAAKDSLRKVRDLIGSSFEYLKSL